MPLKISQLFPNAYLFEYIGYITLKHLQTTYEAMNLGEKLAYILVDGSQMMYEDGVLDHNSLTKFVIQTISPDTFKTVVFILAEKHPLRDMTTRYYERMGYMHKMKFVASRDEGIALIKHYNVNANSKTSKSSTS